MNLKKRLQALERLSVPPDDGRCEACGYAPGLPVKMKVTFRGDEPDKGPDVCPDCGRRLIFRLSFADRRDVGGPEPADGAGECQVVR